MKFAALAKSVLCVAVVLLPLGSCGSVRIAPKGADNENLHTGALRQVNPLEVAVLPVQNSTTTENLPLQHLRDALIVQLVKQRYTPLSMKLVDDHLKIDAQTQEASYSPGDVQENALLQTFLTRWDDSRWKTHSEVTVGGEIYLLDVGAPDPSRALWGGKFERRMTMMDARAANPTDSELLDRLVERLADELLASLPARDPEQRATR